MARTKESKAKAHPPSGNRKYSSRGDNSLDKFISSNGQIYGTLTLDTRSGVERWSVSSGDTGSLQWQKFVLENW